MRQWRRTAAFALVACGAALLGLSWAQPPAPNTVSPSATTANAFPAIGTRVRVHLADSRSTPVPSSFYESARFGGQNNWLVAGKVTWFDGNWVGLEADDGAKAWIPRESIGLVHEAAAATKPAATR